MPSPSTVPSNSAIDSDTCSALLRSQSVRVIADVMRHNAHAAKVLSTVLVFFALPALGGDQFETPGPLKAFVHEEYALGSDYLIRGKDNTVLFRCIFDQTTIRVCRHCVVRTIHLGKSGWRLGSLP